MGTDRHHARRREIGKVQVETPLIVPSFSSRGFSKVSEMWKQFRYRLNGAALGSLFDMAEGLVPISMTDNVNLAVFDSGLYETRDIPTNGGGCHAPPSGAIWTRSRYHKTLIDIDKTANSVLVNYDHLGNLKEQIALASEDFSLVPSAAADFLIKPEPDSMLVNVAKLSTHAQDLGQFDVIGITAREMGDSLLKRCSAIVTLRDTLDDAGLDLPIHVFGAITPYEVLAYFFCGADVFDGLNWLRLAFRDHTSIPIEEVSLERINWNKPEPDLFYEERTRNLGTLYRLQEALGYYSNDGGLEHLEREFPIARRAAGVAHTAGAEIRDCWRTY